MAKHEKRSLGFREEGTWSAVSVFPRMGWPRSRAWQPDGVSEEVVSRGPLMVGLEEK